MPTRCLDVQITNRGNGKFDLRVIGTLSDVDIEKENITEQTLRQQVKFAIDDALKSFA